MSIGLNERVSVELNSNTCIEWNEFKDWIELNSYICIELNEFEDWIE